MHARGTVVVVAAAAALTWSAPALAEPDAGLRLTVDAAPSFVVGSQGGIADVCGYPQPDVWSDAAARLGFRATSPSGITGYTARVIYVGQPPGGPRQLRSGPLRWQATNYDDGCGGGSVRQDGWHITARDSAGHAVSVDRYYSFSVTRWDDRSADDRTDDTWSFSPGWTRSGCACADGGSQNYTTAKGRAGSYRAHATAGEHLGLMMATGPGRGRADVYVDGTHVALIDTRASTNTNRVYVWDSGPLAAGDHVVRVVNQATAGRPRIDVNAMGVLQ